MNRYTLHIPITRDLPTLSFHQRDSNPYVTWKELTWPDGKSIREYFNTDKEWYLNGQLHRDDDLPAIEQMNGHKHWFINGKRHRDNGKPALVYADGHEEWWVNGERIK